MITRIIASIDEALEKSEIFYIRIKEYKIYLIRKFLGVEKGADLCKVYSDRFPGAPCKVKDMVDIIRSDGIIEGIEDMSAYEKYISDKGYPLIMPENIRSLRFFPEGIMRLPEDLIKSDNLKIARGGDILMKADGGEQGASAVLPFMHEDSIIGPGLIGISIDNDNYEIFYILNILHFYYNTGIFKAIFKDREKIDAGALKKLAIPVPEIEKQKRIAGVLLQLSGGMTAHESYDKELRDLRKSIAEE